MNNKPMKYITLTPAILWLSIFFIIPLLIIFIYSFLTRGIYGGIEYIFTFNNYARLFEPLYLKPILRSIYIAGLTTVLCLLIGYPLAYFISNQNPNRKKLFLFLMMLPFWTNYLVRTYAWMIILRTEGLINNFLISVNIIDKPLEILYTEFSVIIGLVYVYLPFMVLPIYASTEKLDKSLLDASSDLGASPFQTFFYITIPLTKPGIIAGSILVFIPSLGAFITPDLLGGAKNLMIGNLIKDQYLSARDWPYGSALSIILMIIVLAVLHFYRKKTNVSTLIKDIY